MKNSTTFQFNNPLSLNIQGSGEYVKRECEHLVDLWDMAEHDHLESIKQDEQYYE